MRVHTLRSIPWIWLTWSGMLLIGGCKHSGNTFNVSSNPASWNAVKNAARRDLNEVPPPSKNIYLAVHTEPQWQNPFLTVDQNMIQVRIYLPDENTSSFDRGGLTRITAARRQVLDVRLADLPKALSSLPDNAWPYGRVVAVQEGLETHQDRVQIRRNLEATERTLDDLGIVIDDWNSTGMTQ